MFLPHILSVAEPVPAVASPIPIIISKTKSPTTGRGAAIDVRSGSAWLPLSFHDNAQDALEAFNNLSPLKAWGNVAERFRIDCHRLDLGTLATIATERPLCDWER